MYGNNSCGATTAVIRGVTSGIGDAVQNVFELDKALTEFKKVSDLSGKGLEDYTDQAFKVGRTVAKTGTEMVEAAT
jgi:phage-related minor tail protein